MDAKQGTAEWKQSRVGVVTASRFADVLTTIKSGESAARYNYKAEIVAEKLTNLPTESFSTAAMQWGTDHEPEARVIYAAINNIEVGETGLIKHETLEAGASPDGLVGDDGLIEIKCPNTATHIQTLISGKHPKKYDAQMQGQMWITGRKWCDFVSYDPRLSDELAIFITRVERDDEFIAVMATSVEQFIKEVDEMIEKLGAL